MSNWALSKKDNEQRQNCLQINPFFARDAVFNHIDIVINWFWIKWFLSVLFYNS